MFALVCAVLLLAPAACKRKDPEYQLKPESGEADVSQFDRMEDQPKYLRVKKAERDRFMDAEGRRKERERLRAMYRGELEWDQKH